MDRLLEVRISTFTLIKHNAKWHILFIDSLSSLIHLYVKKKNIAKKTSLAKGSKKPRWYCAMIHNSKINSASIWVKNFHALK